jgi:spermidine synthase
VAALAGLAFTWRLGRQQVLVVVVFLALAGLSGGNAWQGWITISVDKAGREEAPPVYEHWNAHSRVTVYETACYPFFWAVDASHWEATVQEEENLLCHALLLIDAVAGTPIQEFHGDLAQVAFVRHDLVSFVYHLVERPRTLVIGPGGGRDVLAALVSGTPHVTAVEVNPAVVDAVRGPFADFAGHLYERPDVTVVVDDARGYIARSPERYDVIQASLIDTWAAGGSGAFALSENSLYTVEAFRTYYDHLTDRGILSVSRWYLPERPAETMRLVSTGMAGWTSAGVTDPRQHVAVVMLPGISSAFEGLATALFKRTPFTLAEVVALQERAEELGFSVIYAPGLPFQEEVGRLIAAEDHAGFVAAYPLDISPATDDQPFFFNLVHFGDLLDPSLGVSGVYRTSMEAVLILATVLGVTTLMGGTFVLFPLWLGTRRRGLPRPSGGLLTYFAALGAAFMLVEVPTIQRLAVYLGRPVYSLAVVLFSLLLFSGLGSLWTGRRSERLFSQRLRWFFPVLLLLVGLYAVVGARLLDATFGWTLAARLAVAVVILAPLGFLMGMPFPLGMRWAGTHRPGVVPWLWGVNGVTSVLGSALAIALAIHIGLRTTMLAAAVLYGFAGLALVWEVRQKAAGAAGGT